MVDFRFSAPVFSCLLQVFGFQSLDVFFCVFQSVLFLSLFLLLRYSFSTLAISSRKATSKPLSGSWGGATVKNLMCFSSWLEGSRIRSWYPILQTNGATELPGVLVWDMVVLRFFRIQVFWASRFRGYAHIFIRSARPRESKRAPSQLKPRVVIQ